MLWGNILSVIVGAFIGFFFTWVLTRRKEKAEEKRCAHKREIFNLLMNSSQGMNAKEIETGLPKIRFAEGEVLSIMQELLIEGITTYLFENEKWGLNYDRIQGTDPTGRHYRKRYL